MLGEPSESILHEEYLVYYYMMMLLDEGCQVTCPWFYGQTICQHDERTSHVLNCIFFYIFILSCIEAFVNFFYLIILMISCSEWIDWIMINFRKSRRSWPDWGSCCLSFYTSSQKLFVHQNKFIICILLTWADTALSGLYFLLLMACWLQCQTDSFH